VVDVVAKEEILVQLHLLIMEALVVVLVEKSILLALGIEMQEVVLPNHLKVILADIHLVVEETVAAVAVLAVLVEQVVLVKVMVVVEIIML
jgi:hypothetical protein